MGGSTSVEKWQPAIVSARRSYVEEKALDGKETGETTLSKKED